MNKIKTAAILWIAASFVNELYRQSKVMDELRTQVLHQDQILKALIAFEMPDQNGRHLHPSWLEATLSNLGVNWEFERITKKL